MRKLYQYTLWLAFGLALIVVVLGAYTRLSDAGLGCPDWPGCYGKMIVPEQIAVTHQRPLETGKAWKEMIHRYAAGSLGILIVCIFTISLINKARHNKPVFASTMLLCTVIFQALLGMWTVTQLLNPLVVTTHLLGGFTTLSLIGWLILRQSYTPLMTAESPKGLKIAALLALVLVSIQITLGGWASTNYAALACGDSFPSCQTLWWPETDFIKAFTPHWEPGTNYEYGVLNTDARTAIHLTHRIGALIVFLYIAALITRLLIRPVHKLGAIPYIIAILLLTQVTLGILNVKLTLPISTAVFHNLGAALLLLSVITLNFRLAKKNR